MRNDILKDFFRKPIVAVNSAVIFLTAIVRLVFSLTGIFRIDFFNIFYEDEFQNSFLYEIQKYNINFFELFIAAALLIFFLESRRKNGTLSFASAFFKTGSVISLIFVIICLVAFLALATLIVLAVFFSTALFLLRFFPVAIISGGITVVLATILLIICILVLLFAISQLLFAGSVRKSVKDGKTRRGTAMFFAVMNLIFAAVFFISASIVSIFDNDAQQIALTVNLLLSTLPYLFLGITALNYFTFIKSNR